VEAEAEAAVVVAAPQVLIRLQLVVPGQTTDGWRPVAAEAQAGEEPLAQIPDPLLLQRQRLPLPQHPIFLQTERLEIVARVPALQRRD
jgi:hypothetical protein